MTTQAAQDASDVRWQIEELHRGLKQLTGTEKFQHLHRAADAVQVCRKGRSQRSHIACCYHAWLSLKVKAKSLGKTLYQTKGDLLSDYLRAELDTPRIHLSCRISESPEYKGGRFWDWKNCRRKVKSGMIVYGNVLNENTPIGRGVVHLLRIHSLFGGHKMGWPEFIPIYMIYATLG